MGSGVEMFLFTTRLGCHTQSNPSNTLQTQTLNPLSQPTCIWLSNDGRAAPYSLDHFLCDVIYSSRTALTDTTPSATAVDTHHVGTPLLEEHRNLCLGF
jgi:hypothetical protein